MSIDSLAQSHPQRYVRLSRLRTIYSGSYDSHLSQQEDSTMTDYVQVDSVDSETVLDSGATGGGCLVDGQDCGGYYCTSPATLQDGREVELTAEHLYGEDGRLVRSTATVSSPDDLEGAEAEGQAVREWLDELAVEYAQTDSDAYECPEPRCDGYVQGGECVICMHEEPRVSLSEIDLADLTATDLAEQARTDAAKGTVVEAYSVTVWQRPLSRPADPEPETAELVWYPRRQRAGIAWGGDAQWTDADSPQDAAERYWHIDGKELIE